MDMGQRIKELRIEKGLTQEELAEKLGMQKSAIAKYENGRATNLKRSTIEKMCEIFDCSPSYLLGVKDGEYIHIDAHMGTVYEQFLRMANKYKDDEEETANFINAMKDYNTRPEINVLFKASKGATPEQIQQATEYLNFLKTTAKE